MKKVDSYPAKPFIKWVGGKTQLLDDIKKSLLRDFVRRVLLIKLCITGATFREKC